MHDKDIPLYYRFDSIFKVVNDGLAYCPIAIYYTDKKPDDDYEYIKSINHQ